MPKLRPHQPGSERGLSQAQEISVDAALIIFAEIKQRLLALEQATVGGLVTKKKKESISALNQCSVMNYLYKLVIRGQGDIEHPKYVAANLTSNYKVRSEVVGILLEQITTEVALLRLVKLMAGAIDATTYRSLIMAMECPKAKVNWDLICDKYGITDKLKQLRGGITR